MPDKYPDQAIKKEITQAIYAQYFLQITERLKGIPGKT